ncbi:GNAT family N-acetyltransferase [Nonomuraea sp. SMC257]|uniref:GNAT family N-acetyltransferase n=1 Tax=Nonomuraea montanisoli TaxID=2741721 RepID=A0A7Y6IFX2_9ACTN|nr:GNAT family N-acetyltransferase [Nonomuraea montanisoli]NUW36069.1 GNAT family N-acetyltransferase [Nonomuraea montanisoli]
MTVDTTYASVRQADGTDRQAVLDVLTEAFMTDPLACWLHPRPGERGLGQRHLYRSLLDHPAAEAYLIGDREGAAVWLTLAEGQELREEPAGGSERQGRGEGGARLRALGEALARRHPDGEPHLYLPCMAVVGGRRGAGLGSALLRHGLERADSGGLPAYLEASSPRSRALYLRHGFEDLGEPVRVADSPLLWPMRRPPTRLTSLHQRTTTADSDRRARK